MIDAVRLTRFLMKARRKYVLGEGSGLIMEFQSRLSDGRGEGSCGAASSQQSGMVATDSPSVLAVRRALGGAAGGPEGHDGGHIERCPRLDLHRASRDVS